MAPIKFEEDMKERLEKRTIQPSAKSWDTLSKRLDKAEKKNTKKGYWWFGIAASIVGVLLVSNIFTNNNQTTIGTTIVEDNTILNILKDDSLTIKAPKSLNSIPKIETIVKAEIKNRNSNKIETKTVKNRTNYATNTKSKSNNKLKNIASKTQQLAITDKNLNQIETPTVAIENKPNTNSSVNKIKPNTIPDKEANSLLAIATQRLAMQKSKTNPTPIDYNGLLISVEDELEETFRDKMFKVVKKGYSNVLESVADRNN